MEEELDRLVALHHTIETDPERLRILVEKVEGAKQYSCHLIWITPQPIDALEKEYQEVETKLYKLARYNSDILLTILDRTKLKTTVLNLTQAFGISELPALIVSSAPIDIKSPQEKGVIVFSRKAIDQLAKHNKISLIIENIPHWAQLSILEDKVKFEGKIKPLLGEFWDKVKPFIRFLIQKVG